MRVHVITHAVVEADNSVEIYPLVAEHLERINEHGSVVSMAIQHGDWIPDESEVQFEIQEDETGHICFIEVGDQGQSIPMLRRLAINALAAAAELERLDHHLGHV